ncbi:probable molybdenum cofactor biosynthesis protein moeb2(mpt-synthase sulfurylase) (molybdopterin synthase [Janibacter sp. HTCC2649]|uniref:ThiF family adenylyltransferase n=1 Tax=Janibacter sp. HTCC2649 TaxID=313589 RepID=UPI0000670870|nr:ThiF family adenylyltransferase [Janibacter sp. HTCC2649]EAP99983.1 probable molybdenum cofactor biosynthesis protein moeb2(mpt-synthase sulfurylase) (molybdopterin synthase [Janibacter sp. HTCC2649]
MPLAPVGEELSPPERTRFARHVILPGIGDTGQRRLRAARVLVVGAGGLGSPILLYLAAAGVGQLTVVDDDVVESTNLQRQVVHGVADVGRPKVDSAVAALRALAPDVAVTPVGQRLTADNILALVADHDVVVDGADNFPTRYLVGDACARLGVPHVWGSVYQHDAQTSVWWAGEGPCYRCVFPTPPPPGAVPSCSTGGVLGASCGAVGSVMAEEVVKLLVGGGEPLVGRLLLHDAWRQEWSTLKVAADPDCVVCGAAADPQRPLGIEEEVALESESASAAGEPALPSISVAALALRLRDRDAGADAFVLVDVREPGEREVVTIPGAVAVPLAQVRHGEGDGLAHGADGIPTLVYCKSGARSAEAVRLLRQRGVDAIDVTGGVLAWVRDVDPSLSTY